MTINIFVRPDYVIKLIISHFLSHICRAQQQTELAKLLQDEKVLFNEEAKELEKNLNDLKHQKVGSERIAMCCIYYIEISPFIYKG